MNCFIICFSPKPRKQKTKEWSISSPSSKRKHILLQPTEESPPSSPDSTGDDREHSPEPTDSPSPETRSDTEDEETGNEEATEPENKPDKKKKPKKGDKRKRDENNNDEKEVQADELTKKKPRNTRLNLKLEMDSIEEEQELINRTLRRVRSDTVCNEELTGFALIIRQEMESYARYRCLTQVGKYPSQMLYSRFYSARPYLLVYTRWLASEGIYQSSSINVSKRNSGVLMRRGSSYLGSASALSRMSGNFSDSRRSSLIPGRRGSLLPDLSKLIALAGSPSPKSSPKEMPKFPHHPLMVDSTVTHHVIKEELIISSLSIKPKKSRKGFFKWILGCVSKQSNEASMMPMDRQPL